MRKLKYILDDFRWIKALFSPFKPFKIRWYIGKTKIGVPYFLPRKWVKATPKLAFKAAKDEIKRQENRNKLNPQYAREIKPFEEIYNEKMEYSYPVPLKVGFSYCGLGWKTKWNEYDIRYEWNPVISFVFFGYQIAISAYHKHQNHYWESWLCYEYRSDKKQTKQERIEFCRRKCPQTWRQLSKDGKDDIVTDYWDLILKSKYLK